MTQISPELLDRLGLSRPEQKQDKDMDRLGQSDFLKLMTTQLENQDPMEPMDNGDFLGQMAQFSTVTGIEELSKSFKQLAQSLGQNQTLQAASLVGKDVLVPVEFGELGPDGMVKGAVDLDRSTEELQIDVYSPNGERIRRMNLGAAGSGLQEFSWNGMRDDGTFAPPGVYEFKATARSGTQSEAVDTFLDARVESVAVGNDSGLALTVQGLGEISFSDVRRIGG
ncbi:MULTISPECIES: flagellar hook assembly protein FlgD [unclassified Thioalkalivibrio]|uniref:flagellar hook assembly protein FlgD n=1 Tax=unclassified Thioalkalivibrio TaxID=2621013 RepID=UPI0003611F89|nr:MULTISPECIES: flagellar hook assembly protein FlgD [unclassified Thioalkalivibrio]